MSEIRFIRAPSLAKASRLIQQEPPPRTALMAGGTDLLVLKGQGLIRPRSIVYLKGAPGGEDIRPTPEGGLAVGALVSLDRVATSSEINRDYPILAQAARSVASPQIRHKATIGGNICLETRCWFYNRSPFWRTAHPYCRKASGGDECYVVPKARKGCFAIRSGDTTGPLVALGAEFRLVSAQGERLVLAEDFFLDDGIHHLEMKPGEVLTEVILPPPRAKGAFVKFRPQNNLDFAVFTISYLPPSEGLGARLVVGSVASKPIRALGAEEMLDRGEGDPAAVARQAAREIRMVSFVRGPVAFKRRLIEAYLTRILTELESAGGRRRGDEQ